jgi:hypothetical protein
MRRLPAESIDSIVCDPPYGLKFMGVAWDTIDGRDGDGQRRNIGERMDKAGGNHNPVDSADASRTRASENRKMQDWHEAWAREALRVLKPGGHLLAFGGSRTYHRLVCAIEDAGFEVRDTIAWMYGSGFPKSLDVGKAIDKAAGAERAVVGRRNRLDQQSKPVHRMGYSGPMRDQDDALDITAPATPDAERWQGWGTALKPAHEPIVVARKPLAGTVAANVLRFGVGGLNIDGCRIGTGADGSSHQRGQDGQLPRELAGDGLGGPLAGASDDAAASGELGGGEPHLARCTCGPHGRVGEPSAQRRYTDRGSTNFAATPGPRGGDALGRWPANVVLSHHEDCRLVGTRRVKSNAPARYVNDGAEATLYGDGMGKREVGDERPGYADADGMEAMEDWECHSDCPVRMLDEQTGELHSQDPSTRRATGASGGQIIPMPGMSSCYADSGGASRFFYVAKASSAERNAGLGGVIEGGRRNVHPLGDRQAGGPYALACAARDAARRARTGPVRRQRDDGDRGASGGVQLRRDREGPRVRGAGAGADRLVAWSATWVYGVDVAPGGVLAQGGRAAPGPASARVSPVGM